MLSVSGVFSGYIFHMIYSSAAMIAAAAALLTIKNINYKIFTIFARNWL